MRFSLRINLLFVLSKIQQFSLSVCESFFRLKQFQNCFDCNLLLYFYTCFNKIKTVTKKVPEEMKIEKK